jgi:hypothetical protein
MINIFITLLISAYYLGFKNVFELWFVTQIIGLFSIVCIYNMYLIKKECYPWFTDIYVIRFLLGMTLLFDTQYDISIDKKIVGSILCFIIFYFVIISFKNEETFDYVNLKTIPLYIFSILYLMYIIKFLDKESYEEDYINLRILSDIAIFIIICCEIALRFITKSSFTIYLIGFSYLFFASWSIGIFASIFYLIFLTKNIYEI